MASTPGVFQELDKLSKLQSRPWCGWGRTGILFSSTIGWSKFRWKSPKTQTITYTLRPKQACAHTHTHPLMHEYPHSVDLSLWRCCSGLICHANCCLGVPLQGESPALEELSFASWSLQESTSFPLPREKLWNSQHVFLHSLLETTALHTVLLHPIWMEIERENQGHKRSFPCVHWKERSYMLRSFLNSQISLL